jgi:hypothetical protein
MLVRLNTSLPTMNKLLKNQFELQDEFVMKTDFLLDYSKQRYPRFNYETDSI